LSEKAASSFNNRTVPVTKTAVRGRYEW